MTFNRTRKALDPARNRLSFFLDADGLPTRLTSLLIAAAVVIIVFPDVIFDGKSILVSSRSADSPMEEVRSGYETATSYLPEPSWRWSRQQMMDILGPIWQLDPAMAYMRRVIHEGQSLYWNPYVATGGLGIETIADTKSSIFTIVTGLFGDTVLGFHVARLLIFFLAAYCLFRTMAVQLRLCIPGAIAACFVFMLSGFALYNLGAMISNPYILAPIALHGMIRLNNKPTVASFAVAVAANAVVLTDTFVPVLVLTFGAVQIIALFHGLSVRGGTRPRLMLIVLQGAAVCLALFVTSWIWLPVIASFQQTGLVRVYNDRKIAWGADYCGLLSLFTPKHFWESYTRLTNPGNLKNFVPTHYWLSHIGIIPAILAFHAVSFRRLRSNGFLLATFVLFVLGVWRLFALFPMNYVGYVPVLKSIQFQYWSSLTCLMAALLVGLGVHYLNEKTALNGPVRLIYVVVLLPYLYLFHRFGFPKDPWFRAYVIIIPSILIVVGLLLLSIRLWPVLVKPVKVLLVILLVVELHFYMNHMRPDRDLERNTPPLAQFLKAHAGDGRILNVGRDGMIPNWGSLYGLNEVGNTNTQALPWFDAFFRDSFHYNPSRYSNLEESHPTPVQNLNAAALDMLSVKYIIVTRGWTNHIMLFEDLLHYPCVYENQWVRVFENPRPGPRAFAAPFLTKAPLSPVHYGISPLVQAFTEDEDLMRQAAALGVHAVDNMRAPPATIPTANSVKITRYRNAHVTLRAKLARPSVVVLMDAWHPRWRAFIDGKPAHQGKVDQAFRGVAVAAGDHVIDFDYVPAGFYPAMGLVGLALAILLGALLFRGRIDRALSHIFISPAREGGTDAPARETADREASLAD